MGNNGQNWMLKSEDGKFHISYNSNTHTMISAFHGDGAGDETAIVDNVNSQYYILNGDWRKDYEQLIDKGFKACKDFFDAHQEHKSSWSS